MLAIENLSVSYGETKILRNVSMEIRAGQVVCLLGRNGVGKTTLLKSIMGLLRPQAGRIQLDGSDITFASPDVRARHGIGYVPQGREIFPQLTVLENLQIGLLNVDSDHQPILDEVFGYFPALQSLLSRKGGFLSGGQQQQLAIARALVMRPMFLILDEPTEGIQPNVITLIGEVLENLKKRGNLAILLVEQYLDFATQLADICYVMEKGAIVLHGAMGELDPTVIKPYLAF
ncbi:MAG: urea ABC transporter ATP-binding subunit UrtE [Planctomycetes bacterium]|nr:urea ABC transporter ATP-binding subunit UrtE [Planctomycetota bacterium]